jgi:hypothetical protein
MITKEKQKRGVDFSGMVCYTIIVSKREIKKIKKLP